MNFRCWVKLEGEEEVTIKLLADGMSITKVAKLKGLSEEEIEKFNNQ
ncbi:hypothetical protein [Lentibacillus salicampi]|nr:hypothetical protein [Lentibacillus salicampi]